MVTKADLNPSLGSEQIGHDGKTGTYRIVKEECRSAACDDSAMDLRNLESRIDAGIDLDQISRSAQRFEKTSGPPGQRVGLTTMLRCHRSPVQCFRSHPWR